MKTASWYDNILALHAGDVCQFLFLKGHLLDANECSDRYTGIAIFCNNLSPVAPDWKLLPT